MYTTELHKVSPHNTLEAKKRDCPFLLGEELNRQVQACIMRLCDAGFVVKSAMIGIIAATGKVKKHDSNLLA